MKITTILKKNNITSGFSKSVFHFSLLPGFMLLLITILCQQSFSQKSQLSELDRLDILQEYYKEYRNRIWQLEERMFKNPDNEYAAKELDTQRSEYVTFLSKAIASLDRKLMHLKDTEYKTTLEIREFYLQIIKAYIDQLKMISKNKPDTQESRAGTITALQNKYDRFLKETTKKRYLYYAHLNKEINQRKGSVSSKSPRVETLEYYRDFLFLINECINQIQKIMELNPNDNSLSNALSDRMKEKLKIEMKISALQKK